MESGDQIAQSGGLKSKFSAVRRPQIEIFCTHTIFWFNLKATQVSGVSVVDAFESALARNFSVNTKF